MRSLHSLSVVLIVLVALPGLVAGGAFATCLHVDPAPHQCGALGIQCEALGGLHAGGAAHKDTVQRSRDCSCSHAPALPADPATVVSSPRPSETSAPLAVAAPVEPVFSAIHEAVGTAGIHAPPAETSPVFLLDCALLI